MAKYKASPSRVLSEEFVLLWKKFSPSLKTLKTRYEYLMDVNRLCEFSNSDFICLSSNQVQEYFKMLSQKGLTVKTIQGKLSCFKSISKFIEQNIDREWENPFSSIHVESFSEFLNPNSVPTLKELDIIMEQAKNDNRLYLIFSLILRCGLSASEVSRLHAEMFQLDGMNRMFLSISSGNKTRRIKIPKDVANVFIKYTEIENIFSGPLLYNKKKKPLSYHALCDMVRECMHTSGFNYTMQDLRNVSMAHMLKGGATTKEVADYAGISERWLYRYQEVLEELDVSACDYQHFIIK